MKFEEEMIDMDVLKDMSHDDLKDVGVRAFGQRHKILKEVRNLKSLNIVENIAASQEFFCQVCKEIFPSVEELGTHVQSHTAGA